MAETLEQDHLLTTAEAVDWLAKNGLVIRQDTWRGYVHRGRAPAADDPGSGPVNRRQPRWWESTLRTYLEQKNARGGQAWRAAGGTGEPLGPVTFEDRPLGPRQVRVLLELPASGAVIDVDDLRDKLQPHDRKALNVVLQLLEHRRLATVTRASRAGRKWIESVELTEAGRRKHAELTALDQVAAEATKR